MKRSLTPIRFVTLSALAPLLLLVAACGGGGGGSSPAIPDGGGGGGGGDVTATFTGDANSGGGGDVSMEPGPSTGSDFDVDVKVNGPLDNLYGVRFRVAVPPDILLIPGSSANGSVLVPGATSTIFDFSQTAAGETVFVVATRVQPGGGFEPGVDIPAGLSQLVTLRFRATDATVGAMNPTNEELSTCNDILEVCADAGVTFSGGDVTAN